MGDTYPITKIIQNDKIFHKFDEIFAVSNNLKDFTPENIGQFLGFQFLKKYLNKKLMIIYEKELDFLLNLDNKKVKSIDENFRKSNVKDDSDVFCNNFNNIVDKIIFLQEKNLLDNKF